MVKTKRIEGSESLLLETFSWECFPQPHWENQKFKDISVFKEKKDGWKS